MRRAEFDFESNSQGALYTAQKSNRNARAKTKFNCKIMTSRHHNDKTGRAGFFDIVLKQKLAH